MISRADRDFDGIAKVMLFFFGIIIVVLFLPFRFLWFSYFILGFGNLLFYLHACMGMCFFCLFVGSRVWDYNPLSSC